MSFTKFSYYTILNIYQTLVDRYPKYSPQRLSLKDQNVFDILTDFEKQTCMEYIELEPQ